MLTNGSTRSWSRTALSFRGACFLSIHPLVLKIGLHLALKRKHLLCFRDLLHTLYDEEDISKYYAGDLISKFFTFRKRRGLSIFFPYSHRWVLWRDKRSPFISSACLLKRRAFEGRKWFWSFLASLLQSDEVCSFPVSAGRSQLLLWNYWRKGEALWYLF